MDKSVVIFQKDAQIKAVEDGLQFHVAHQAQLEEISRSPIREVHICTFLQSRFKDMNRIYEKHVRTHASEVE